MGENHENSEKNIFYLFPKRSDSDKELYRLLLMLKAGLKRLSEVKKLLEDSDSAALRAHLQRHFVELNVACSKLTNDVKTLRSLAVHLGDTTDADC